MFSKLSQVLSSRKYIEKLIVLKCYVIITFLYRSEHSALVFIFYKDRPKEDINGFAGCVRSRKHL